MPSARDAAGQPLTPRVDHVGASRENQGTSSEKAPTVATVGGEAIGALTSGASQPSVVVKDSKWDYFFGRVTSSLHNGARSLQNAKDLKTLGFKETNGGRAALLRLFEEGKALPEASRHTTKFGVTITRTVKVGDKGVIDVKYFYLEGDMSVTPEISTIIPKVFKQP
jgi:hypothetical protein